ncbi:MAG TPA: hypothetical protein VF044_04780 [Actinomycetota bacterium]
MTRAAVVAAVVAAGAAASACAAVPGAGSGSESGSGSSSSSGACPALTVRAAKTSGSARCVRLPERVRIRLAVERGDTVAAVARRHALAPRAVRSIARAPGSRILPPGDGAATSLRAEPGCSFEDGRAEAKLEWVPSGTGRQVAIVAPELVGLDDGRFWAGGRLAADRSTFVWRRFAGQSLHRWAILTREPGGWRPSATASFRGPLCVMDSPPR